MLKKRAWIFSLLFAPELATIFRFIRKERFLDITEINWYFIPKRVSKIFVSVDRYYAFSEKRAPQSPWKDHRLELIGGTLNSNETPFQGLDRELREEELSGTLSEKVQLVKPVPKEMLVNDKPHFIYATTITDDEYGKLIHYPDESYGFWN